MSGIVGVLSLGAKPIDASILGNMMEALRHRGPIASCKHVSETVGLGQLTRAISRLPSAPVAPRCAIRFEAVVDARLSNRSELQSDLHIPAVDASTLSDTDIIRRAYAEWGTECSQHLKGDFSFAIWDSVERCLFCARDRFGVRPFYFCYAPDGWFIFASEIKALFATNLVSTRLNPRRIAQYLVSDLTDKQITFYQEIRRLPPAHRLLLEEGHLGIERYWSLDAARESISCSDASIEAEFRERFVMSVRRCTENSKHLGAMLSGGLDSSSIVSAASRLTPRECHQVIETVSLVFDEVPDSDEHEYIDAMLQSVPVAAHFVRGDTLDPFMDCDVDFWHQDEPFYTPNLFLHQAMYKLARSTGIDILLDGFDGDVVVSHGLAHISESFHERRFALVAHELRMLAEKWECSEFGLVRSLVLSSLAPRLLTRSIRRLREAAGRTLHTSRILVPPFAKRLRETCENGHVTPMPKRTYRTAREEHVAALEHGAIPLALEVADRASAAYGVEPRYPFFDSDFVDFCVRLPANQKLRDGWTRSILRRAMTSDLPRKVCWRASKSDLSLNFARSLITYGRRTIEKTLARSISPIWEYADINLIRNSYQRLRKAPGALDALQVWKTISLGIWLERVL